MNLHHIMLVGILVKVGNILLFKNIEASPFVCLSFKGFAGSRWGTYFYTKHIEASLVAVYLHSAVLTAFFTRKECLGILIRQIEKNIFTFFDGKTQMLE